MSSSPARTGSSRRALAAHSLGRRAELAAACYLEAEGFEVLGRNLRVGRLEVDLLCRKAELIVVVEVRARSAGSWVRPFDSVDWRKRRRVRTAGASLWRTRFAHDPSADRMRFDIVIVRFEGASVLIEHARAAF